MRRGIFILVSLLISCTVVAQNNWEDKVCNYVNPFIGTANEGRITPVACVPFGMVQVGVDTRMGGSGYNYDDNRVLGISHIHKSGGGCNDFLDILFQPVTDSLLSQTLNEYPSEGFSSSFLHTDEEFVPGNYSVYLSDFGTAISLTATQRCAFHHYSFPSEGENKLIIDLKYGSRSACTIVPHDNFDTVKVAQLIWIDKYTVAGARVSNGWAPEQHVYFYAQFSKPIKEIDFYSENKLRTDIKELDGTDVKAILKFASDDELMVKVGVSPVDIDGAKKNLEEEIPEWNFDMIKKKALDEWENNLSKFIINDDDESHKEMFYTFVYNTLLYPMLYSDVDGRFRGPDYLVHPSAGHPYYAGVIGFWDTFRAACPLLTILHRDVANDYVKTCLTHCDIFGQLPIWVLAGGETFQMIGIHSLPFIADCYAKGIRDYDTDKALKAMVHSANKDTCGFSMRYFVGLKNYKKYGYVPADQEMESVARTLEYAYDDWCIAQMAQKMGEEDVFRTFIKRAENYKNVFDPSTRFMRGRFSDGTWRTPFNPFESNHRRDDYCEGNAWQWTYFVPHDVEGLASLMGGNEFLQARLDSLFTAISEMTGEHVSGDISGLIGQYAHGNEPSHHVAYMYDFIGQPWKTQNYVRQIMETMYNNSPEGICGNDDTGQMSAWFVWSAMGFYPVRHGTGEFMVGTPLFKHLELTHEKGKLTIVAPNVSSRNRYIKSIWLNGKKLARYYLSYNELFTGSVSLEFEMVDYPEK